MFQPWRQANRLPHGSSREEGLALLLFRERVMLAQADSQLPQLPPDRSFGFLFAFVFCAIGGYAVYAGWNLLLVLGTLAAGVSFAAIATFKPQTLRPLNSAWFRIGLILGKIVSPVVLGIIFFGLLSPVGLIGRLLGRDQLRLKKQRGHSYWIDRSPPAPAPDSFKNQF